MNGCERCRGFTVCADVLSHVLCCQCYDARLSQEEVEFHLQSKEEAERPVILIPSGMNTLEEEDLDKKELEDKKKLDAFFQLTGYQL